MQKHAWEQLLRRVPATLHNGLIVSTIAGADLVIQEILRLDETFLVIRGRTAGSTDGGKTIVIPCSQVNYLTFNCRLSDAEIEAIFGDKAPEFAVAATPSADHTEAEDEFDIPSDGLAQELPSSSQQGQPIKQSKSVLLAKLRARIAESSKGKS